MSEFALQLRCLRDSSKAMINFLTTMAEENKENGDLIASAIKKHLSQVKKLLVLLGVTCFI